MEGVLLLARPTAVLATASGVGYGGRDAVWLMGVKALSGRPSSLSSTCSKHRTT
jgi:hypothetical protein